MTLSHDARCLVTSLWGLNPCLKLVFRTPSRIHPRTEAALNELIDAGIVTKEIEKLAAAQTWNYTVTDRDKLREVKRVSQKELKANSFPITKD